MGNNTGCYGFSLMLDLHGCDNTLFNRNILTQFFEDICKFIGAEAADFYFWDDVGVPLEECQTDPRLKGTSAVQFILTSGIMVHTLDLMNDVYIDIFSCNSFEPQATAEFCKDYFKANKIGQASFQERGHGRITV